MPTLDLRPDSIEVFGYAGDTMTLSILAPDSLVGGKEWKAEVRTSVDASTIAATFDVTPPTEANGPAYITLDSETTRALASGGALLRIRRNNVTSVVMRFTGVFDCQVSSAGTDPVRTLVKGTITIDQDVTQ